MSTEGTSSNSDRVQLVPGLVVTSTTPDDQTAVVAAMLIARLAQDGANVAAMVPVETGVDAPCEPGSQGALVRWAAGHLDSPKLVTPFALEAPRSAMHAADAGGVLLHAAALDHARETLCEGRTVLVVLDAVGPLDPITPSLSMLDLASRWQLDAVIVEPASRWAIGHIRLLAATLLARNFSIAGVVLARSASEDDSDDVARSAMQQTLAATLGCPVVVLPEIASAHDRDELLTAADACGLTRVIRRAAH